MEVGVALAADAADADGVGVGVVSAALELLVGDASADGVAPGALVVGDAPAAGVAAGVCPEAEPAPDVDGVGDAWDDVPAAGVAAGVCPVDEPDPEACGVGDAWDAVLVVGVVCANELLDAPLAAVGVDAPPADVLELVDGVELVAEPPAPLDEQATRIDIAATTPTTTSIVLLRARRTINCIESPPLTQGVYSDLPFVFGRHGHGPNPPNRGAI